MKQKNSPAENEIIAAEEAEDSSKGGEAFQKILLFMITVFLSTVAAYLYGRSWMELIGIAVLSACGAGMILFSIEKSRVLQLFLYDNERNLWRFTLLYCIFLLAALLCPLLPKAGWPYLAVFVGLMLFSNEVTGLAAGSSLLMISLLLQNEAEPVTFFVYFVGGMAGILLFSTINESFHIWLPVREFLDGNVYFLEASPDVTLTEPANTDDPITVAYYRGADKSVDINSGRGYTRDRRIKPDFAVPGVQVLGAGPNGNFVRRSGSSVATGITAGACAMIMEWILNQPVPAGVTTSQVANIIILGAQQNTFSEFPNQQWGYGTMDLYQSLDRLRRL